MRGEGHPLLRDPSGYPKPGEPEPKETTAGERSKATYLISVGLQTRMRSRMPTLCREGDWIERSHHTEKAK